MKKPKITEGEWKHLISLEKRPSGFDSEICEIGISLVVVTNGDTSETAESDAKAISAVPDMIDELIKYYNLLEWCNTNYPEWDMDKDLESCKKTLKKAGCK